MTTRTAAAILGLLLVTTAAYAQTVLVIPATPADATEQTTSMPDVCSQLDVNCVLDDGPSRPVVFGAFETETPGTPTPPTAPGPTGGSGALGGPAGKAIGGAPADAARHR